MGITVDELLEVPFANRTLQEQIQIVVEGKPRPGIEMSAVTVSDEGVIDTQNFDIVMYDEVLWLTGSERLQSFFCWSCLLFVQGPVWKVTDLVLLSEGMSKHESTPEHIEAAQNFKVFISQHLNLPKESMNEDEFNEMVRRNRDILKFLIDAVCNVVSKNQPPRRKNARQCQIEPETCVNVLKLQRNYAGRHHGRIDDAIELIKASPILVNDLIDAITKVVKIAVKKEAKKSTFTSLTIGEHSTDPTKSQISTVLRYIKRGKVCERFLGFTNMLHSKSAESVCNFISNVIIEYDISRSFLALSCDGDILDVPELYDVIILLERDYPHSYFVPSYFHGLFSVFQLSLSAYKESGRFMKTLCVMQKYFSKGSKQWKAFESFMLGSIPNLGNSKWSINAPFVKVVNSCRKYFIDFLETIIRNCTKWSADDVINAYGFQKFLKELQTIFLLQVFSSVVQHTASLDEALKSTAPENAFDSDLVRGIVNKLSIEKEMGFENIWDSTIQENDGHDQASKRLKTDFSEKKEDYRTLFNNIIDRLMQQISIRFSSLEKLEFCGMLNKENGIHSIDISGLQSFSNYYVEQMTTQGHNFDFERLKNEVIVLRTNSELFCDKNIYELLECMTDLTSAFRYINKLAEFTLTMPFKPPTFNGDLLKFEKIKKFSYYADTVIASGDISVLNIESDYLQDVQRNAYFYDEVVAKFFEVNRCVEIMRKKV